MKIDKLQSKMNTETMKIGKLLKGAFFTSAILSMMLFTACGGDEGDDPEPEKKLQKELLYNKIWENSGGHQHHFKDGGLYKGTGTWKWLNNSDSMEIKSNGGAKPLIWVFHWNTETQMECSQGGDKAIYNVKN